MRTERCPCAPRTSNELYTCLLDAFCSSSAVNRKTSYTCSVASFSTSPSDPTPCIAVAPFSLTVSSAAPVALPVLEGDCVINTSRGHASNLCLSTCRSLSSTLLQLYKFAWPSDCQPLMHFNSITSRASVGAATSTSISFLSSALGAARDTPMAADRSPSLSADCIPRYKQRRLLRPLSFLSCRTFPARERNTRGWNQADGFTCTTHT